MTTKGKSKAAPTNRETALAKIVEHARLRPKFIRDPVHDIIKFDNKIVLDVLNTEPLQRLKRIRQLGLATYVYPGADHSRFSHSIGAYHLSRRMLEQLEINDKYDRLVVQLAALLHDTGHGPFSHLFERSLKEADYKGSTDHEEWTIRIVREHDEIQEILKRVSPNLARDVSNVIANTYEPKYLSSIVSSQFDVDRLDYMLRDSLMTGVQYGDYDLNWIMRSLSMGSAQVADADGQKTSEERIVVDGRRGLSCLEDYLLGLFNLYKHVYYHKTILAAEGMMMKLLSRAIQTKSEQVLRSPALQKISNGEKPSVHEFLGLDDSVILSWLHEWSGESTSDKVLQDLSRRLLNRQLLKAVPFVFTKIGIKYETFMDDVRKVVADKDFDSEYYVIVNEPKRAAYKDYWFLQKQNKLDQELFIVDSDNRTRPYTEWVAESESPVGQAIEKLSYVQYFIIVPPECEVEVKKLVEEAEK